MAYRQAVILDLWIDIVTLGHSSAILLIITSDKEDGEEIQTNCDHGILRAHLPANQCLHKNQEHEKQKFKNLIQN